MPMAHGQTTSTQGKEFWLSYLYNGYEDHPEGGWVYNQLLISAKRDCSGTITNPITGWTKEFSVSANNITSIDIPLEQGYHDRNNYENISDKALKVVSTDTISVYCTNIAHVSFDASFVLPVESLGDDYIIQTCDQTTIASLNSYVTDNETSAFLIVATEDNTEISITPTCTTLRGRPAGETFSVTLNAGETYQVRSTRSGSQRDLSGTRVTAKECKKIAVFNGNTLTSVPTTMSNGFDHVFEQAMPLHSWGKKFIVTTSLNRNHDVVKIISSADNNEITQNGQHLVTLNANQSYSFILQESERSCFLEASAPSAVYLYNYSNEGLFIAGLGDPSMVWIAPVEQKIDEVTFSTFDNSSINITNHSINIIVSTSDINELFLDGQQIAPGDFAPVNGNTDYSFVRKDISHGVHHISCANGFNAHVYGFGSAKGYAYLVGSNAIDLSTTLSVNDISVSTNESLQYCIDEPMTFIADVNHQSYDVLWDFGDGTTSNTNPAQHIFHERRVYSASLTVSTDGGSCSTSSTQTIEFFIDLTQQYVTENDETCLGELYSGHGFENVMVNNDTILTRLVDNPIHPQCKDSLLLYLTTHPSYHQPIEDSRCWLGDPGIYDEYGFSFEYDEPGVYERQLDLESHNGCDSIINLRLTVADRITYDFDHHECEGPYIWDGDTYTTPGTYTKNYTTSEGCDSIATLHLTMGTNKSYTHDTVTCGTFYWGDDSYEVSGDYTKVFVAHDNCDSTVTYHVTIGATVEGPTTHAESCNEYVWQDSVYTTSGLHTKTYPSYLGCDSLVFLDLDLNYAPDPTEIFPLNPEENAPHWVITATEFQVKSYDYSFDDKNEDCVWDVTKWEFENPNMAWLLEPDTTTTPIGKSCRVYVLNHVPDTVWLRATAYNECKKEGEVRRYWLLCSFYDLEEQSPKAQFEVVPNPNQGQMELLFEHFEGTADIKVYDMRGALVDHFQTYNGPGTQTHRYTISTLNNGIYLFVVSGKDGILTKKVIIAQ